MSNETAETIAVQQQSITSASLSSSVNASNEANKDNILNNNYINNIINLNCPDGLTQCNNMSSVSATSKITTNSSTTPSNAQSNSHPQNKDTVFTLKRWNLVAMWSWDVECEVCAICRTPLMDSCLKCQTDNKNEDCVVVWGDCNHSFHNCCMSQWIKSRNLCPLCQSEWHVQRIGR